MAFYIKYNAVRSSYKVWHGASIGVAAMTAKGYERVETLPKLPPAAEAPVLLSKLAVIRALGENWAAKKAEIEAAGLLDQWNAAAWLDTSDPAFSPWWKALTDAEREMFKAECRY